jgi:hypothetical protein
MPGELMKVTPKPAKIISVPEYKTFIGGGVFWLVFGLVLYFILIPSQIAHIEPINGTSPRTIPNILSCIFMFLGPMLSYYGVKMRNNSEQKIYSFNLHQIRLVLYSLIVISLNIVAFNYIGYIIPAIISMAVLMLLYGNRNYIKIAIYSIALPIIIYYFFKIAMQMYLPNPFNM